MGTYDLTKGSGKVSNLEFGRFFCVKIPIKVSEIIAANATLTANAKITAADVIQLWDIPADVVLLVSMATFKIVVAGTAAGTANIGIGGSNEFFPAIALDAAVGTMTSVAKASGYGVDNYGAVPYTTTDTIDMTFVADETIGEFELYIPGYET